LLTSLGPTESSAAKGPASSPRGRVLERFLEIDRAFHDSATQLRTRSAAEQVVEGAESCRQLDVRPEDRVTCFLRTVLGDSRITPVADPTLVESTVTSALADKRGSCAALVGLVLAVTEAARSPFDAVVLRDHVVLARHGSRNEFFETLDEGRRLDMAELSRHRDLPAGHLVVVEPDEYVAYYLDNLAARLQAEGGRSDQVASMFVQALEIAPAAARIRYNYGTFLLQQDRFDESEKMLSRAIGLGWKDAAAYVNRGAARWRLGRVKAARRDFEKALELDPMNREARVNLERLAQ
jgi:tetratricopeptide (TPR) repeat protein